MPLVTTPLAGLAALAAALEHAGAADRAEALLEADALRTRSDDPDDSWRAVVVYRALADEALSGPDAAARAVWMAHEDPGNDDLTRRFADVARTQPGDPGLRGLCTWAECVGDGAHLRAASVALLAAWGATEGRNDAIGFAVRHALADVFLREGREFEALVAARRAAQVVAAAPHPTAVERAHAAAIIARAYAALGDVDRLRAHLPTLLRAADGMPEPDASRARVHARVLLAQTATDAGDLATATRELDAADRVAAEHPTLPGLGAANRQATRLRVAVATGGAEAIRQALAAPKVPRTPAASRGREAGAHVLPAAARAALARIEGRFADARQEADDALAALADGDLPPSRRLRLAVLVARALGDAGPMADDAARAWHVAADAAFARLVELDGAASRLRAMAPPTPDDLDALGAYRLRFVESHHQVLVPLRMRVAAAAATGRLPDWAFSPADGMVLVCAWCQSVRSDEGEWRPVGHLIHGATALPITHGACPRCLAVVVEDVARADHSAPRQRGVTR